MTGAGDFWVVHFFGKEQDECTWVVDLVDSFRPTLGPCLVPDFGFLYSTAMEQMKSIMRSAGFHGPRHSQTVRGKGFNNLERTMSIKERMIRR